MGKTVEQIYQKKTQHDHILSRPDMYIGTIEPVTGDMWVFDDARNEMVRRNCTWTPGLYKIFDEILVNAADNKVRDPDGQTTIRVNITEDYVRVYNNGEGIPVQRHREHDLWVPEMIFGHLLTSSNYDDDEAKVTGGRNGYGAKLTNVYSTQFEVETSHSRSRKKFYMKWTNNMLQHEEPILTAADDKDYTMITFYPDFKRFHVEKFTEDMMLLMKRRVYDVAGCTDPTMKCYLNGELIPCRSFTDYVDLYPTMGEERKANSYRRVNDRWELCVRVSNLGAQQVSFVNCIATTNGGTHVKYILDQIVAKVVEQAKKKKKTEVKAHMIRPHIFLFVNCLIENPGFDSQTKGTLTTTKAKFGSSCDLPQSIIDYILSSGIVERSVEMAHSKLTKEIATKLKSSDRKQIMGIPKLDDANEAGGKLGYKCTLIVTEGDSAKTLCTAGLAVKDRDFFGVFPLRGKPLNVRDASLKRIGTCEEIQSVMKIMGLDIRQKYDSIEGLRYGHLMIMSDQDHDGSHIKGLIINFIHFFWPNLLRVPGFLQQFITPIVKAKPKGRGGARQAMSFFSMPDYFKWKQEVGDGLRNYEIRYYKGLGTSGAEEGREYFENIDRHRLDFVEQLPTDEDRIVMAFAKDRVEDRKEWITNFKANVDTSETMDYNVRKVSYADFVDKELILFSIADCERSIPSAIDGFKPGQRKILYCCFKRNLTQAVKVVQLSGYVSEHSAYHHGEQSLVQTIVAMAQDFVGSNNVPLLRQDGQFGTRLQGGKDHAAGRYIFTRLMAVARCIFHPADDFVVDYRDDDGQSVEPFYYVPVIPMALVNGTSGIGTGFSTNIPNYNPMEVITNLERLMDGHDVIKMEPWYFGFKGTMEEKEPGKFVSRGKYSIHGNVVTVTELPIGLWTQNYKKFLEEMREKEMVVQYREHNTDVTVDFEILVHPMVMSLWAQQGVVEDRLQLREYVHATNIMAFDKDGQITKYLDAESLLKDFYLVRLDYYGRRREYLLGELRRMCSKLENMVRFVREVVDNSLVVTRRKKKDLLEELVRRQYAPFPPINKKKLSAAAVDGEGDEAAAAHSELTEEERMLVGLDGDEDGRLESPEVRRATRDYDYLLGLRLWNLTEEMIQRLERQLKKAQSDYAAMEARTPKDLWREDLRTLREKLEAYYKSRTADIESIQRKKLEKKKYFDYSKVRVPILSDKAREVLEKEAGRSGGGARARRAAAVDEDGEPIKKVRAPAKKAPKKRRRRGSDEDSSDEDWGIEEDESSSDSDGEEVVGMGDAGAPPPKVLRSAAAKPKPKTTRKPRTTSSPAKKTAKKEEEEEGKDDFFDLDLDGFGLGALDASKPPPPAPAVKKAAPKKSVPPPTTASAAAQSSLLPSTTKFEEDDLLLFGVAPTPPAPKPKGAAAARRSTSSSSSPAKPKAKASGRKKKHDEDSDEEEDSSSSEEEEGSSSSSSSSEDDSDYGFSD